MPISQDEYTRIFHKMISLKPLTRVERDAIDEYRNENGSYPLPRELDFAISQSPPCSK